VAPGGGGEGGPVVVVGMRGRLRDIAGMLRFFEGVFSLSLSPLIGRFLQMGNHRLLDIV
jgi:hypothetical protein